jgi:hypothetical protein
MPARLRLQRERGQVAGEAGAQLERMRDLEQRPLSERPGYELQADGQAGRARRWPGSTSR